MTRMIRSNSVSVVFHSGLDEVWTATQGNDSELQFGYWS